jgi:phosphatidylglycerophosphate synthase
MSQTKVFPRHEFLPDTGGTLASSLTVAVLTGAIGWFLIQQSVWQTHHLMAAMTGFVILASIVNFLWISKENGGRFGEANQATLLRTGLVCLIGSTLLASGHGADTNWYLISLIAVALMLDAVDGFLARQLKLCSAFGARFDMEIDALLLLILSLLVWQTGQAGIWVLAIGLMRYVFVAASWIWPKLCGPLRPSLRRKTICALQGIALMSCLLPPLAQTEATVIAAAALVTLTLSFGIDIKALLMTTPSATDEAR